MNMQKYIILPREGSQSHLRIPSLKKKSTSPSGGGIKNQRKSPAKYIQFQIK